MTTYLIFAAGVAVGVVVTLALWAWSERDR
jgi:hypothetical protein